MSNNAAFPKHPLTPPLPPSYTPPPSQLPHTPPVSPGGSTDPLPPMERPTQPNGGSPSEWKP